MVVCLDCSSQWETITIGLENMCMPWKFKLGLGTYVSPMRRPVLFFSLYLSQNFDDQIYTALSISSS